MQSVFSSRVAFVLAVGAMLNTIHIFLPICTELIHLQSALGFEPTTLRLLALEMMNTLHYSFVKKVLSLQNTLSFLGVISLMFVRNANLHLIM